MPFKFNAARRHRIPRARYRVRNWPAYEAGLKRRGDLTLWIDEAALGGWQAPRRTHTWRTGDLLKGASNYQTQGVPYCFFVGWRVGSATIG